MTIVWGDCIEKLAEAMFSSTGGRCDPFDTECTVVGSPVMAGWLKQYFLYDLPAARKPEQVLACWDFKMLHPFVNDWLARACDGTPVGERAPAQHPYSPGVLQWRIWNALSPEGATRDYPALRQYMGDDPAALPGKRWGLAVRLAALIDDYQNYRGDLLADWERGGVRGLNGPQVWQANLWRCLSTAEPGTYLQQFAGLPGKLEASGITAAYRRLTVFHVAAMPPAYMGFFAALGKLMPVTLYAFNPSKAFWIDDSTVRQHIRALIESKGDPAWYDPPHAIVSGFGRGTQALLGTVLDVSEGDIHRALWGDDKSDTLLHGIQQDIRNKDDAGIPGACDDGSIQFHACHGPVREVEVVRDLVLQWFAEHPESQPRDVQVLVSDIDTYAPFIESVFRVTDPHPFIPCAISKRPAVSAGAVGAAFVRLMKLNESRLTAPDVMELLELDPVRERYGFGPGDISALRGLVNAAGIRWGRDGRHVESILGGGMPDTVTWRRGLDRLLAGFAIGRSPDGDNVIMAGELGDLVVCDAVEGGNADLVARLARFLDDMGAMADGISARDGARKVSDWVAFYRDMLVRFFRGTERSYAELAEIRRGLRAVDEAATMAGDVSVTAGVMAAAVEAQLGGMAPAGAADINAVLFSPLRTMQVTPRKLIVLLGLNEGVFPRADARPAFDLLAGKPRYGDRSLRHEDRLAFLETLMSARERLIVTYTGRSISNDKEIPPSPAVTEFQQYLNTFAKAGEAPLVHPVAHKLHGFSPEYYKSDDRKADKRLFSYSRSNYEAARILAAAHPSAPRDAAVDAPLAATASAARIAPSTPPCPSGSADDGQSITLDTLQDFFTNPARHFFNRILQIRLPDPLRDQVQDSELFDANSLDRYKLNDALIKDLLRRSTTAACADRDPDDRYYHRFQAQSLIPLGGQGVTWAKQQFLELRDSLNAQTGVGGRRLFQSLHDRAACMRTPTVCKFDCGTYAISATLPLLQYPDAAPPGCFLLTFRYAGVKAKDQIRAWLAHVVGHAAGHAFQTVIKSNKESNTITLVPLDQASAASMLERLLTLYDAGCRALLPFAPESSLACAKATDKAGSDTDPIDAAAGKWNAFYAPESSDRYLFAAWGDAGPMQDGGFAERAVEFWRDYLNATVGGVGQDRSETEDAHV